MKSVDWIFAKAATSLETNPEDVLSIPEQEERHYRAIRECIVNQLRDAGVQACLSLNGESYEISPLELHYAEAHSMRLGIFMPTDFRLENLRHLKGAQILIPDDVARAAISRVTSTRPAQKRGRRRIVDDVKVAYMRMSPEDRRIFGKSQTEVCAVIAPMIGKPSISKRTLQRAIAELIDEGRLRQI